jgi:hypothetical protein
VATTKTITETRTVTLATLQEYADESVAEPYRQPLKTIHEALAVHGWDIEPLPEDYKPICCGVPVACRSFLGSAYVAECETCGRFIADVTAPSFGNSCVVLCDSEKVDVETERRWIAGQRVPESCAKSNVGRKEGAQ